MVDPHFKTKAIAAMFALLLILANQGMAQYEIRDDKLKERIILKGTLITEWSENGGESQRMQVYHYDGQFYGCIYYMSNSAFTISCHKRL